MEPVAQLLPDGKRLHLQHGPIDLIIGADGARDAAFAAAKTRFETVLSELVGELALLKLPMTADLSQPIGETARRMDAVTRPHADVFVTRMAGVAGAVADTVLDAMKQVPLSRAYVNNGGDIALHLTPGTRFRMGISDVTGAALGRIDVGVEDAVGGVATSGRHGRSLSMGIADSVTVLAHSAAAADVAATLIANAVDLPGHVAVTRRPANDVRIDSDLGTRLVVTDVGALSLNEINQALAVGVRSVGEMMTKGLIVAATLFLRGETRIVGSAGLASIAGKRIEENA